MKLVQKMALKYLQSKIKLVSAVSEKKAAKIAFNIFCTPFTKYTKPAPKIFETGTPLAMPFLGETINGFKFGADGSPTILILHGWDSCMYKFDKFVKPFTTMGLQVYMFDAMAHGTSTGKYFNVYNYAALVCEISKNYGPFNNFMAHSLGGMAAVLALANNKQWLLPSAKIVLIAPGGEAHHFFNEFYRLLKLTPNLQIAMQKQAESLGRQNIAWYSTKRHIVNISNPILWLHDHDDMACPIKYANEVYQIQLPNILFEFSKGLGHSIIYRDAKTKQKIFNFIAL